MTCTAHYGRTGWLESTPASSSSNCDRFCLSVNTAHHHTSRSRGEVPENAHAQQRRNVESVGEMRAIEGFLTKEDIVVASDSKSKLWKDKSLNKIGT